MSTHLDLAVRIADAISAARSSSSPLDVEALAHALLSDLRSPVTTREVIAQVLYSEAIEAGVPTARQ